MRRDHAATIKTGVLEDWPAILDEYGVQFLALDIHSDGDLLQCCRSLPGWVVDFEDGEAMLLARTDDTKDDRGRGRVQHGALLAASCPA